VPPNEMQLKLSLKANKTGRIERPNDRTKLTKRKKKKLKPNDKGGLQTLIKLIQKGESNANKNHSTVISAL